MSNKSFALSNDKKAILEHLAKGGDVMAQAILDLGGSRPVNGALVKAPTTASTQATGTGATAWRVNVDEGLVVLDGKLYDVPATADLVLHSATQLVANGQSAVAAVVAYLNSGTLTLGFATGAAATTGSQVAPTDAAIQTAVGAGKDWLKLAECTINRTGDTTVTQSQDNTKRDVGLILPSTP